VSAVPQAVTIEPPYGVIWSRIKAGKVVPFLGAGASMAGRPGNSAWKPQEREFLPSGRELAEVLAKESSFPSTDALDRGNLAKVSSWFEVASGRDVLRDYLRDLIAHPFPVSGLHTFLAEVPAHQVIVVTNYDTLVEQAFATAGKPYDLIVHPTESKEYDNAVLWWRHGEKEPRIQAPNELDIDLSQTTVIYKMHGTLSHDLEGWDNFVITEEDYVDFLSRMTKNAAIPAVLHEHFRSRNFLFLGYSLSDWNLRVILKNLSRSLSSQRDDGSKQNKSWAIQRAPSTLERELWQHRNVSIFDLSLEDFLAKMRELRGAG
jgi:hypothetical protein